MARRRTGSRLQYREDRGVYYLYYTDAQGRSRQRSTGTSDFQLAQVWRAEFEGPQPVSLSDGLITDLLSAYAQHAKESVADPQRIGYALTPLIEFCQGLYAHQIDESFCRRYRKWRQEGVSDKTARPISDGTVRRELTTLRAAVNLGRHGDKARFWLPAEPDPRPEWLKEEEAAALLWAARQSKKARRHLQLFIVLGLGTGQRKSAILGLKWSQIDVDQRRIDFRRVGVNATNKRRPIVPISPKLAGHLRRARRRATSDYVFEWGGEGMMDIKRSFAVAVKAAGLSHRDITPHTLRHTVATWMMQRGVAPFSAAGFLGMTVATLLKVYGHWHPDYQRDAVEVLS